MDIFHTNHRSFPRTEHLRSCQHLQVLQIKRFYKITVLHIHVLIFRTDCPFFFSCFHTRAYWIQLFSICYIPVFKALTWNFISNFSVWAQVHHIALLPRDSLLRLCKEAKNCESNHEHMETNTCYIPRFRFLLSRFQIFSIRQVGFFNHKLLVHGDKFCRPSDLTTVGTTIYIQNNKADGR